MIKSLLVFCVFLLLCNRASAQKTETFDILTYSAPKSWQRKVSQSAVQFGVDNAKGTSLITVFKALPGTGNAQDNFKTAWETIVKGTIKTVGKPEMQPAAQENGWTVASGASSYESDGKKGIVALITMTGQQKMVNILVLTDTDAHQAEITAFLESVHLPNLGTKSIPPTTPPAVPSIPRQSRFKFTTTNFDDGWTATEQSDWVQVTKGNTIVLVHYPNPKVDAYNSVLKAGLQNAWNLLVATRYTNIRNFDLKPIQSFESIDFVEADAEDKMTHKNVHVVLFKKHFYNGKGKYIEFITSSKTDFEQEFGPYHNDAFGWDKLVTMQTKNKFAVSSADLTGKWSTSNSTSLAYYYVNGGGYAGATATSTADTFTFAASGMYQSEHSGASGMVGNQKFSQQVYKGKFSVDTWTLTLTKRFHGETEKYNCAFEAIKGGRILLMTDKHNTVHALVK